MYCEVMERGMGSNDENEFTEGREGGVGGW